MANAKTFSKMLKKMMSFVKPDLPGALAPTLQAAMQLTERNAFSSLFTYRYYDQNHKLVYLDDGDVPAVGFVLSINPLMVAGVDAEPNIEAMITSLPPDSVITFGKLSSPQVEPFLNTWTNARLVNNTNPILRQVALRRRDFMLNTTQGPSMLPHTRLHPRMYHYYIAVRIPYDGEITNHIEMQSFLKRVADLKGTVKGAWKAASGGAGGATELSEIEFKFLVRELANPHLSPKERLEGISEDAPLCDEIVSKTTRVTVRDDGRIGFSKDTESFEDTCVTCITVDSYPKTVYLPMMALTLGNPVSWDERITCPYWAYTTVHVKHADDARDELTAKFGMLNKQTMSESPWFRSMMGHLYERKDMAGALLKQTGEGHTLVRSYTGINLYTTPEDAKQQAEFVKGLYRRAGFRVSEEPYISLPVFIASFPLQYTPVMDPPNKGLQRASLMHSLNAASTIQVQGDWTGTDTTKGGLLLTSRSGQLATFDLLQTSTNYNFVVIAASGSGKSFLTNEIVGDFLSRGGVVRLIDVGRSYARMCEIMKGENIIFSPDSPMSLNPFTGIDTIKDLNEMMPMLKDLLRLMAFPLTPEELTPAYQYQLLEKAIEQAWERKKGDCELKDVVDWLREYSKTHDSSSNREEVRAGDLALQLEPFSHGRYKRWFSGRRTVSFTNPFVVIELEELNQDTSLQSVVLQLMMFQVTKEMYLSDRKLPKLLAIDEAWALMGGMKTGKFIETAFRRMRKYNGIAGVITQSFEDFEKSPAAKAAIENAEWQFILYQRPESIDFAVNNKRISTDQNTVELIKSVKSGDGFSEVFVRSGYGSGLYRFITDRHSYYTFTTKPKDINNMNALMEKGLTIEQAIDHLANQDYKEMWAEYLDSAD